MKKLEEIKEKLKTYRIAEENGIFYIEHYTFDPVEKKKIFWPIYILSFGCEGYEYVVDESKKYFYWKRLPFYSFDSLEKAIDKVNIIIGNTPKVKYYNLKV